MPIDPTQKPVSIEEHLRLIQERSAQKYSPLNTEDYFGGSPIKLERTPDTFERYSDQEMDYMQRYGVAPDPGTNLNERLAQAQSSGDMIWKGIQRLGATTVTKAGQGAGYMLGLIDPTNWDENIITNAADNAIAQAFASAEESLKEELVMFQDAEDAKKGFFMRAATDLNFWTDDVVDGVAFMASTMMPGAGVRALRVGEKIMGAVAKSKYAGLAENAMAGSLSAPNIQRGANAIDKFTSYATMTSMEAMFEADGVRKTIESDALAKFRSGEINIEQYNELQTQAKASARDAFALNMAFLAPSNLFEQKMLNRMMGRNVKKSVDGLEVKGSLAAPDAKFTPSSVKNSMLRGVGEGIAAEGLYEENIQYSIEKINTDMSPEKRGLDFLSKVGEVVGSTLNVGEYDKERGMAIGIGSIIGSGGGALSSRAETKRENKRGASLADAINKSSQNYASPTLDVYKRDATGAIEVRDGEPVLDDDKVAAFSSNITGLQELDNVLDNLESKGEKAKTIADYAKRKAFGSMASAYYQAGLYDEFKEKVAEDPELAKQADKLEDLFKTKELSLTNNKTTNNRRIKLQDIGIDILNLNSMRESLVKKIREEDAKYEPGVREYKTTSDALAKVDAKIASLERILSSDQELSAASTNAGMFYWGHLQQEYENRGEDPLAADRQRYTEMLEEERRLKEELTEQVNTLKESLPFDPSFQSTTKQRELDMIDLAELEIAQSKRAEQWKNLITPAGTKAYTQMLKDLETAYFNPYGFDITKADQNKYDAFENASLSKEAYSTKRNNTERKFNTEPLNALIDQGDIIGALQLVQKSSGLFNPEAIQKLKDAAQKALMEIEQAIDEGDLDAINDQQDLVSAMESAETNLLKSSEAYAETDEQSIRIKIAENFIAGGQEVLQNIELSPEYDNLEEAQKQISILTKLAEFVKNREGDNWPDTRTKINDTIKELEDSLDELARRKADRDAQIGRVVAQHTKELYLGIGINIETGAETPVFEAIRDALEKQFPGFFAEILAEAKTKGYPYHFAYAVMSKLSSLSDIEKAPLRGQLATETSELEKVIEDFASKVPNLGTDMLFKNPASQIYSFLEAFLVFTNQATSAKADHPIKTFLRTHDLAKLELALAQGQEVATGFSPDDMLMLIQAYKNLTAIHQLDKSLDTFWQAPQEIEAEIKAKLNNKGLVAPSEEQVVVLREIMTGLLRNIPAAEPFEGWVYLTGFAGTGKTNLMARWVKQLLNLAGDKIYAVSATPQASMELNASLGLTAQNSIDDLIAKVKGGTKPGLIVIDEVGRIPKEKLNELAEAIAELNKKATAAGLEFTKVLALGDPNQQVAASQAKGSPMDNYYPSEAISHVENLFSVHSMTTRFRSDVPSITDFQDIFLGATVDMRSEDIKVKSSQADPLTATDDNYGVVGIKDPFADVVTWASSQNLKDNRSRAVIVSEDKKAQYVQLLAAYPEIKIYTPAEVQGLTISQVFVDITPPASIAGYQEEENKTNYTSFSRASELLMVVGFNLTNVVDPTIPSIVKDRQAKRLDRSQEFLNAREDEYKDIAPFFGIDPAGATNIINTRAQQGSPSQAATQPAQGAQPAAQQTAPSQQNSTQPPTPGTIVPDIDEPIDEPNEEDEDIVTEEETEVAPDSTNPPAEIPAPPIPAPDSITLHHPTSQNIEGPDKVGVSPGQVVYFIKQRDRQTNKTYVRVIAEVAPGQYVEAAVLGEQEIDANYPELRAKLNDPSVPAAPLFPSKSGVQAYTVVDTLGKAAVVSANYLSYTYGPIKPFEFNDILSTFLSGFLGRTPSTQEYNQWKAKAQVVIFSTKSLAKFRADFPNSRFTPRLGFAYLQVSNNGVVQHIPLTRNELNPGDPLHRELLTPIAEFESVMKQIEAITSTFNLPGFMLGNTTFNGFISKLGQGNIGGALYHLTNNSSDPAYTNFKLPFSEGSPQFEKLALLARQAYMHYQELDYNADLRSKFDYKIDPTSLKVILSVGMPVKNHKTPFTVNGKVGIKGTIVSISGNSAVVKVGPDELTVPIEELFAAFNQNELRAGAAQRSLNKIARSNTLFNGVMIQTVRSDAKSKNYVTAKGILAHRNTFANGLGEQSKVWDQRVKPTMDRLANNSDKSSMTPEEYAELVKGPGNSNLIGRLTLANFSAMIAPNQSPVRTYMPIQIQTMENGEVVNDFSYKGEDQLNSSMNLPSLTSYVGSSLSAVSPSVIKISKLDTGVTTPTNTPSTPSSTPSTGFGKAKFVTRPVARLKKEGDKFNTFWGSKKAMRFLKRMFPNITPDQLQMVNQAFLTKLAGGKAAWGYFKKGVIYIEEGANETDVNVKILKHEAFHRVWRERLSPAQRARLQKMYSEETGIEYTEDTAEEAMADLYMDWKNGSKIPYFLLRLFKAIAKLFRFNYQNFESLDEFFFKMESGYFTDMSEYPMEEGAAKLKIEEVFGTVDVFLQAKAYLKGMIKSLYMEDVFTREDIYNNLREVTDLYEAQIKEAYGEDLSEVELAAFEVLKEQPEKGLSPAQLLWKEHYGKITFHGDSESGESADNTMDAAETAEKEVANLSEHILSADSFDRFKKVLASAKDFMSTIQLADGRFLSEKAAFVTLAKRMYNLDINNPENFKKDIDKVFSGTSPNVIAIRKVLLQLVEQALADIVIMQNEEGKNVTVDLLGYGVESDYTSMEVDEPNLFRVGTTVYTRKKSDSTNLDFIERVSRETSIPVEVFKAAYYKTRANNMLSTINNAAGSLETRTVMVGTRTETEFVKIEGETIPLNSPQYLEASKDSNRSAVRADIVNAVAQGVDQVLSWEFPTITITDPQKGRNIKSMLGSLGLLQSAEPIYGSSDQLDTWITNLKYIRDAVKTYTVVAKKDISKLSLEEKEEFAIREQSTDSINEVEYRLLTLQEYLDKTQKANLAVISKALANQMLDYESNSSYKNTEGKTKWLMSLTSQAAEIYAYINTPAGQIGLAPGYINNEFMKMNPILAKEVRIGDMVYHTEIDKGFGRPLDYKNEGYNEVLERLMFYAFMPGRFKASTVPASGDALTYYQFTQINSNKPETRAVEMTIKSQEQIRDLIRKALIQEAYRPDVRLKNYTPGISNFPALENGKLVDRPALPKDATDAQIEARINEVVALMDSHAQKLTENMVASKMILPSNYYKNLASLSRKGLIREPSEELEKSFISRNRRGEKYKIDEADLLEYTRLFVYNHYMNGYFLNQLVTGDQSFFKDSYDVIKRMSIAWGTGYRGRVSEKYGLPVSYKTAIITDVEKDFSFASLFKGKTREQVESEFKRTTGEAVNLTDAQGFITPEFAEKMRKGFGREMQLGNVMKPVHFEVDAMGVPRAVKYSAIVLTKELREKFPELETLYLAMNARQVDQVVFDSAVKVGLPVKTSLDSWEDIMSNGQFRGTTIDLKSSNLRIQLNPRHSIEGHVTQPSQLLYFLSSDPANFNEAMKVYDKVARVEQLGQLQVNEWLGLRQTETRKQKKRLEGINPYLYAQRQIKAIIAKNATESSNTSQQEEVLKNKNISLNFPLIADQAQLMFNSWMSKKTVEIKYSGTKMVLQSSIGTGLETPRLIIDEDGKYAMECYVPEGWGKSMGLKEGSLFIGFRIPSTELHSGVPFKIKGFLKNSDNVIITPPQITWLHGSDFDVDALFCIHKEEAKNDVFSVLDNSLVVAKGTVYKPKDTEALEALYKSYREALNNPATPEEKKKEIRAAIYGTVGDNSNSLISVLKEALKNEVVTTFEDIFRDPKNLESMMSPITMEYLKGNNQEEGRENAQDSLFDITRQVRGLSSNAELFSKRDLNLVGDYIMMHQDNFSGAKATGIFANATKGYNYLFAATGDPNVMPGLGENVQFELDGVKFDTLSKTEKTTAVDSEGTTVIVDRKIKTAKGEEIIAKVGERFDSLVNAAIDNVKEQILSIINVSNATLQSWVGLLATGAPLESVHGLMMQPSIMLAAKSKGSGTKSLKASRQAVLDKLKERFYKDTDDNEFINVVYAEASAIAINFENLKTSFTQNPDARNPLDEVDTKEGLIYQLAVLDIVAKGDKIGNHISLYSSIANLAKSIPSFTHDQAEILDIFTKIYEAESEMVFSIAGLGEVKSKASLIRSKGKYSPRKSKTKEDARVITGVDILGNVPHIEQAYLQLKQMYANNSDLFDKTNKYLIGIAGLISYNVLPKLRVGNKHATKEFIVKEYLNYMLSGTAITDKDKKVLINLDDSAEPPVEIGETYMEGSKAWAYRFTNFIEELRNGQQSEESIKKYGRIDQNRINNKFLHHLSVTGNTPESRQLRFFKTANIEQEEVALYRKEFMKFVNEDGKFSQLQYDMVKYLIITQGLRYGASNYGPILDPNIFIAVDKAITENITNKLYKLNASSAEERATDLTKFANSIKEFTLQLAVNNADSISSVPTRSIVKDEAGNRRGVDEVSDTAGNKDIVYYDLKLSIPEAQKEITDEIDLIDKDSTSEEDEDQITAKVTASNSGPEYLTYYGAVFKRVQLSNGFSSGFWYYQEVGKQSKIKMYKMNSSIMENGFNSSAVFKTNTPVRVNKKITPDSSGYLFFDDSRSSAPLYPAGTVIGLRRSYDISRTVVYLYRVEKATDTKNYTLKYEGIASSVPVSSMNESVQVGSEIVPTADDTIASGISEVFTNPDASSSAEIC